MNLDPKYLARLILTLAALGLAVLLGSRVVGGIARKAPL
jgi:hypothetical protein